MGLVGVLILAYIKTLQSKLGSRGKFSITFSGRVALGCLAACRIIARGGKNPKSTWIP